MIWEQDYNPLQVIRDVDAVDDNGNSIDGQIPVNAYDGQTYQKPANPTINIISVKQLGCSNTDPSDSTQWLDLSNHNEWSACSSGVAEDSTFTENGNPMEDTSVSNPHQFFGIEVTENDPTITEFPILQSQEGFRKGKATLFTGRVINGSSGILFGKLGSGGTLGGVATRGRHFEFRENMQQFYKRTRHTCRPFVTLVSG